MWLLCQAMDRGIWYLRQPSRISSEACLSRLFSTLGLRESRLLFDKAVEDILEAMHLTVCGPQVGRWLRFLPPELKVPALLS